MKQYFTLKKAQDLVRVIPKNLSDQELQKHIVKLRDFKRYIDTSDKERLIKGGYFDKIIDAGGVTGLVPKDMHLQINLGSALDEAITEKARQKETRQHCWRCGIDEVYETDDNNGMCYNCYAQCKIATEEEQNSNFEDGEL